jgi:hypothetical protein
MLTIAIFDKDALSSDDFLGSAEVNLTEEFRGQWIDHEINKHFVLKDPETRVRSSHLLAIVSTNAVNLTETSRRLTLPALLAVTRTKH